MNTLKKWLNGEVYNFEYKWLYLLSELEYDEQVLFIRELLEWHRLGKIHITIDTIQTMMRGTKSTIERVEEIVEYYPRYQKTHYKAYYTKGLDISLYFVLQFLGTVLRRNRIPYIMELYYSLTKIYKTDDEPLKFEELIKKVSNSTLLNRCNANHNVITFRRKRPVNEGESVRYDALLTIYDDKKTVIKFYKPELLARTYKNIIFGDEPLVKNGYAGNDLIIPSELFGKVSDFLFSQADLSEGIDIAIRFKETENTTKEKKLYSLSKRGPYGLLYCEGHTPDHYLHKLFQKPFKWCGGYACFNCTGLQHIDEGDYENYTIYDFVEILKPGWITQETLLSWYSSINNFYSQIKHMHCRECNHMMEPIVWDKVQKTWISDIHARYITSFRCNNESCSENGKRIYVNHCFTENCNNIIDSRETKQCSNHFYICKMCGVCCAKQQFKLKREAGLLSTSLQLKYDRNEFHFDKQEFFCPKCGCLLIEKFESDIRYWECPNHSDYYGIFPKNPMNKDANEQLKELKKRTVHEVEYW